MTYPRIATLTALVGATLAACTASDQTPADTALNEVTFHANDYSFQGPDTISAGMTRFTLVNDGPGYHHIQLVRLDSAKTLADLETALKTPGMPPGWAVFMPGPNSPDPKGSSILTAEVAAGNYAVICVVDIPEMTPYFARGMVKGLTVTAGTGAMAAAPTADIVLTMFDYNFTLSTPLTAGRHVIEVVNTGPQPHEVFIMRLAPGKTLDDFGKWMATMEGTPPGTALGGTTFALPGVKSWIEVDFSPGDYALLCFVPDAKDGKPHLEHGMVQPFKIE
ncbi:MAG: hypothetical protein O2973_05935 [Gemmatimonadetes bacterium]|nr:hypothetical protein [Gemmatimonadota bacterium]